MFKDEKSFPRRVEEAQRQYATAQKSLHRFLSTHSWKEEAKVSTQKKGRMVCLKAFLKRRRLKTLFSMQFIKEFFLVPKLQISKISLFAYFPDFSYSLSAHSQHVSSQLWNRIFLASTNLIFVPILPLRASLTFLNPIQTLLNF